MNMSRAFRITPKRVKRSNGQVLTPDMFWNILILDLGLVRITIPQVMKVRKFLY